MTNQPITDGGTDGGRSTPPPHLTYEIDDDEPPSEAVVRAVAALTDVAVLDLDPLYEVADPEQLDEILVSASDDDRRIQIVFEFGGCTVTVLPDEVRVRTIDDGHER